VKVLVDSDWIISGLKGRARELSVLADLAEQGLPVSVVSLAEIYEGVAGDPDSAARMAGVRRFLQGYAILHVTEPVAEVFASVRSDLRRAGNLIPDMDLLIAATALHHDLALLTRNVRHFGRVPRLRLH
jgi:tRNA(fMet)-specific endonuclease VapC